MKEEVHVINNRIDMQLSKAHSQVCLEVFFHAAARVQSIERAARRRHFASARALKSPKAYRAALHEWRR